MVAKNVRVVFDLLRRHCSNSRMQIVETGIRYSLTIAKFENLSLSEFACRGEKVVIFQINFS